MHNISHMTRDTIAHRQTGYSNKKRQLYIERKRERERVSKVLALESTEKKASSLCVVCIWRLPNISCCGVALKYV